MKYVKQINNGYIVSIGTNGYGTEITESEYNTILDAIHNKPKREGYDYRLREDLTWEEYELPVIEEPVRHTVESLEDMTTEELKEILQGMGISTTMTKANMIRLILAMESEV